MKKSLFYGSIIFLSVILISCGGSSSLSSTDEGDIPDWYLNTPKDDNILYASSSATSKDMQLAINKAATDARAEIARNIELRVKGLSKKFDEEVGQGEKAELLQQFTQVSKVVVSTSLSGSEIAKKEIFKSGGNWRAYVLAKYPIGEANRTLQQQIRNNKNLYTRFRETQAMKQLDDEVEKFEEWKKSQ